MRKIIKKLFWIIVIAAGLGCGQMSSFLSTTASSLSAVLPEAFIAFLETSPITICIAGAFILSFVSKLIFGTLRFLIVLAVVGIFLTSYVLPYVLT